MSKNIFRGIAPLLNFKSDSDKVSLWGGRTIQKMTFKEFSNLEPRLGTDRFGLFGMEYVLEVVLTTESDDISSAAREILKSVDDFIRTLRLFKKGAVHAPQFLIKPVHLRTQKPPYPSLMRVRARDVSGEPYVFHKSERDALFDFFKKVTDPSFGSSVHVKKAISRFLGSYYERAREDKIIDYFISFESLFCRGRARQYKGETIAIGASMLLGTDNSEREEIREYSAKAYGVRNDIIHSSFPISDSLKNRNINDDERSFTLKVEDYLRNCIKRLA